MLSDLLDRLTTRGEQAEQDFDALAIAAVEGRRIAESKIEAACSAAGKPLTDFVRRVELLRRRKDAADAVAARDWSDERTKLGAELRANREAMESAKAELKAIQAEQRRLSDEDRRLRGQLSSLQADEKAARDDADDTLRSTGDPDDWRSIGEPTPRPRRHKSGETIYHNGTRIVVP